MVVVATDLLQMDMLHPTRLLNPGLVRDFFLKISASTLLNLQVVFNPSGTDSVSERCFLIWNANLGFSLT